MPIATPDVYVAMLDSARERGHALPAVNVDSSATLNAVLQGLAEAESDGIVQITPGGADFLSGHGVRDIAIGARALAEFAHIVAARYSINIALHTDHCPPKVSAQYIEPLLAVTRDRAARGELPLFQSHMLDGSSLPLEQNLDLAWNLLQDCAKLEVILELEVGVVGGTEDGARSSVDDPTLWYTDPTDILRVCDRLGTGEDGRYLLAVAFGNVHGYWPSGPVELRPAILKDGQELVIAAYGEEARHDFVFHGGSGSPLADIRSAIEFGVVKLNINTDTQYAFTRPIADHLSSNYSEVVRSESGSGTKSIFDPRTYLRLGEDGMAKAVVGVCSVLGSTGRTLG